MIWNQLKGVINMAYYPNVKKYMRLKKVASIKKYANKEHVYYFLNKNKMRKGKVMEGYILEKDSLNTYSIMLDGELLYEAVPVEFIFKTKKDALKYTKNYRKTYKDRLIEKYKRRLYFINNKIDDINKKWDRIKKCQLDNLDRLRENTTIGTSPFNRRIYESDDVYFIDDFIIKKGKDNGMLRKGIHTIYLYEDEYGIENGYSDEIYYNTDDLIKAFNIRIDKLRKNELKSILLKRDNVEKELEQL
jgi:hypothetical protein